MANILNLCTDKYSASDMTFRWKDDSPLRFPSDFADGCRLPRYVVSFEAQPNPHTIYYGESTFILVVTCTDLARIKIQIAEHFSFFLLSSTAIV